MNDYLDVNNFVDSLDSFDDFGVLGDCIDAMPSNFSGAGFDLNEEQED